jgi:ADP-ribose pyrophosphatase YjhB (NUDIX family)
LVSEMFDEAEGTFHRPPGGGIEFGEHSREAAARELQEEFDLVVPAEELRLLGVIENSFDFRDAPYHEICFIYEVDVDGIVLERLDGVTVAGLAPSDAETARVFELSDLVALDPLYPQGVQRLLVPVIRSTER